MHDGRGLHAGQAPGRAGAWRAGGPGGRRHALCIGIDRYPANPLYGCVADVRSWTRALRDAGFDAVTTLLDEQATREAILGQLADLIDSSQPGDVVVFHYSGHGTYVRDLDGDEQDGDTPHQDEAICPVDFATGALIVDDDIGRIFDRLPDGVNLTCFMDCCHSGTISRFGVGNGPGAVARGTGDLPRFIVASPALDRAHERYRAQMPRAAAPQRGQERMREVVFSACLSREVAWESGGQGEFTVRATRLLSDLNGSVTNAGFADLVTREFGHAPRQQPRLYSNSRAAALEFLAPLQGLPAGGAKAGAAPAGNTGLLADLKQLVRRYERLS